MIKEIETKAAGAATVQTTGRQMVLRSKIKPDPNQPRKEFKGLEELAASLTADGFLECLKVREEKDHYVLIDGERRFRASELAGIERVPVEVISAKDVLKVQLLFGTQRANLSALEQAHTAGRLLEERRKSNPKFSVEDLAKELSAKRATMYELMALNKVSAPVREALMAGKLDASKARLFATVPPSEHAKLLKEALGESGRFHNEQPMSVRELEEHIEEEYSKQLKGAPFDQTTDYVSDNKAAGLYFQPENPKAITVCAKCPLRSGNIEGWTGNNPHVCTNVKCFEVKTKLFAEQKLATAKARGQEIVPPAEYQRSSWEFAKSDERNYGDPNHRTWGQLGKAAGVSPRVTVNKDGAAVEVFTPGDKRAIMNKLRPEKQPSAKDAQKAKEIAAAKKRREPLSRELLKPILLGLTKITEEDMMLFLGEHDMSSTFYSLKECRKLAGWPDDMKKLTAGQRRAVQVMMIVEQACGSVDSDGEWGEEFADAAKLAGIDLKAEEKKLTEAAKPDPKRMTALSEELKAAIEAAGMSRGLGVNAVKAVAKANKLADWPDTKTEADYTKLIAAFKAAHPAKPETKPAAKAATKGKKK